MFMVFFFSQSRSKPIKLDQFMMLFFMSIIVNVPIGLARNELYRKKNLRKKKYKLRTRKIGPSVYINGLKVCLENTEL